MASRFPRLPSTLIAKAPTFSREQIAFLEDMLVNRACGPAMLSSLTHGDGTDCMECAARMEGLVIVIRALKEE